MPGKILPHLTIILSFIVLTLAIIDRVNRAMGFLDNDLFRNLLLVYCIAVIATSIYLIRANRRSGR